MRLRLNGFQNVQPTQSGRRVAGRTNGRALKQFAEGFAACELTGTKCARRFATHESSETQLLPTGRSLPQNWTCVRCRSSQEFQWKVRRGARLCLKWGKPALPTVKKRLRSDLSEEFPSRWPNSPRCKRARAEFGQKNPYVNRKLATNPL
jgi:hypothetical protein